MILSCAEGEGPEASTLTPSNANLAEVRGDPEGEPILLGNEFAEVRVTKVRTRNGARLLIESTKSGDWIALCPLALESLTWQLPATFSAMVGSPFTSLVGEPNTGA
jgi:hypothetical protein